MCGRRKLEKDYPELCNWGNISWNIIEKLVKEIPKGIIIQFHFNGEPLLYPELKHVLKLFKNNIRCFNTNGKLLIEKAKDIIDNMESLTISVIENDPEGDEQYDTVEKFLKIKGDKPPYMVYRLLGNIENKERWYSLPGIVCTRILHNPMGSFNYTKTTTKPEHGICLDLLSHLVIDRYGDVYPCVRFNPQKINLLGNIKDNTLEEMWTGVKRKRLIEEHIKQNRNYNPLCASCEFYGIPKGD
jgi:radical SAM protein with 4Fe4S-binding SPASM domain